MQTGTPHQNVQNIENIKIPRMAMGPNIGGKSAKYRGEGKWGRQGPRYNSASAIGPRGRAHRGIQTA